MTRKDTPPAGTSGARKKEPHGSFFCWRCRGFSLPEIIAVLLIAGVLAAVAFPRLSFVGSAYDEGRLYDQSIAALRFAQKAAVSMQRTVCVAFSGGTTLSLTYAAVYGSTACPGTPLPPPSGGGGAYTVVRQGSAGYAAASNFSFDRIGRPSAGQVISLVGGRQIAIEAETGYVH